MSKPLKAGTLVEVRNFSGDKLLGLVIGRVVENEFRWSKASRKFKYAGGRPIGGSVLSPHGYPKNALYTVLVNEEYKVYSRLSMTTIKKVKGNRL